MEKNMKLLSPIQYEYGNLKIGGGGFIYAPTSVAFIAMTLINKLGSIWQTKLPQTTLHRPIPLQ